MITSVTTDSERILAVDVGYQDNIAIAAGVLFANWDDERPCNEITVEKTNIEKYIPGQFFRRELSCILALINRMRYLPHIIVVDGFVYLGSKRRPGLGHHLYMALQTKVAVIGVAKKPFQDTPLESAIFRGNSRKPLFVTATGIDEKIARGCVLKMHGKHRIPTLLKAVDRLSKQR